MKSRKDKIVLTIGIFLFLLITGCYMPASEDKKPDQTKNNSQSVLPEKAIKNFEQGIKSENTGLKKSAIYLAGVYKIKKLVKPLLNQFVEENDENIKFLIALALYTIGDKNGVAAIKGWQNR